MIKEELVKRKNLVTKAVSVAASASMVAGLFPVSAMAVTGDKIAADGTYTASANVLTDDEESWNDYDVSVDVEVSDGKIASINVTPGETSVSDNAAYIKKAKNGVTKKGTYYAGYDEALVGQAATEDTIENWEADAVSGATIVSEAIKAAAKTAINSASEAAAAELDTSALEQAISNAANYAEADYTADSWKIFSDALSAANSVLESKESQSAIDTATETLNNAIEGLVKAETEEEYTYVYMNIPYDKFYENEVSNDVAVDAYTSATKSKPQNWGLSAGSYHEDETGSAINGAVYAVKVPSSVDLSKYTQITDDSTVTIETSARGQVVKTTLNGKDVLFQSPDYSYYEISGDVPSSYKELSVNEDGSFSFGKATGEATVKTVSATLDTESSYGDYQLDLDISSTDLGYGENETAQVNGVVINTTDGSSYGLRTMENIWRVSELAWCTGFTSNVHGSPTSSAHYVSMMGKTIDSITYYTTNGIYTFEIDDTYVPVKSSEASISAEDALIDANKTNISLSLPSGYEASASVPTIDTFDGTVNLTDSTLTWTKALPGKYNLNVTDLSGKYADISTSFILSTNDIVADYDSETTSLAAKEGISDSFFKNFLNGISSVSVNGTSYAASGRGAVSIIDKNTGAINTEAKSGNTSIFAEDGDYTIVVNATGYNTPLTFTYTKSTKVEDEYSYVYVGLTWAEYWANEGVYAADNTESSTELDSHSEYDKGGYDAVSRATTRHGVHRGSYQTIGTIYDVEGNSYSMSYWNSDTELVLANGETATFDSNAGTINGIKIDHYEMTGFKYIPVKVKTSDLAELKAKYTVVENGGTLAGGYGEQQLQSYSVTANVTANTYGLKEAVKGDDGFTFSARSTEGTESGIKDQDLKTATDITVTVKDANGTYGEFLRVDLTGAGYGDLGANMQGVTWTYYGNDSTYTEALCSYGTKFAADNWMHKSMGIQLGLTNSYRCQLPEGYDGTGYWKVTVSALGYEDYSCEFQATEDNIVKPSPEEVDTTELQAAVDAAKALDQNKYTEESWSAMQMELSEAEELLAKEAPTQAEVDEAAAHLNAAVAALVIKEHEHTYSDWTISQLPSENTKPEESRTCSFCNQVEVREIETQPGLNIIYGIPYVYDENNNFVTNGTPTVNGAKYFVQNGVAQTGLLKLGTWQMYADPETYELATGLKEIEGKTYLFDKNGVEILKSRTEVIDGKKYWFQEDGSLKSGWSKLGNWTMYFDPETFEAAIGVKEIEGKTYLFDANGVLYEGSGTPVINGKKYYVQNGVLKSGWLKLANWQMYFDPETYEAAIGVTKIDGKAYLFDKNGVEILKSRTEVIDGKKYWFQPDGSLMSGWCKLGNWTMYFDPETYVAATGTVRIDGSDFTFDANGVLIAE